ncbi:GDSL-type esterase/lipase family protein [Lachnospiraceae bacterium ZAX-1]
MKHIFLGDSITKGAIPKKEDVWIHLISNMHPENEYVNKGIAGDTTAGMLSRFYRDVVEEGGRCVVIMGGLNDLFAGADSGLVNSNLMALVHQAYFYSIKPILCIPPIPIPKMIKTEWSEFADCQKVVDECMGLRRWLTLFSRTFGTFVIDFEEGFKVLGEEEKKNYFIDGIHPNEKGNEIMARWIKRNEFL